MNLWFNSIKTTVGKVCFVPIAAVPVAAVPIAAVAIAAVQVAAVPVAAVPVAAVPVAAVPVAAVPVAAVPVAAVAIAAVPVAAVPVAAVPVAAVPVAAVPVAAVPVAAVPVAAVAKSGATLSRIHDFKKFSPRYFTNKFKLIRAVFITLFNNIPICNYFRNLIVRIKTVIVETVDRFFAEVHTLTAYFRCNIFFKFSGTSILLFITVWSTSPI